jgi:PII-like signaling protein
MTSGNGPENSLGADRLGQPLSRLTIYIGESDTWRRKPLYTELVHRAHAAGLAGASVFRGIEGYGSSNRIHTARLLSLAEDLPVAVVLVDTPDRIESFLPQVDEVVGEGLVALDEVRIMMHQHRQRSE